MKKTIFLGLALLGLAFIAQAAGLTIGGTINAPNVQQDGNGVLVLKVLSVDPSGTPYPTPTGGSGSSVIVANTTPIPVLQASPTPGILPVSPTTATLAFGTGVFTYTTHTTLSQSFTVRANITLRAANGGTSVPFEITTNPTPSANVATLRTPFQVVTGASEKTYGPCYEANTTTHYIHGRASGTASVEVPYAIEQCK